MKIRDTLMMTAASAVVLAALAVPATAQQATGMPVQLAQSTVPASQSASQVPSDKLIGRTIKNAQDETVGEIKSVMLGSDGRAESVIVGVGGFLGMGEHEVAIGWNNLQIRDNGETVRTSLTKEQLKALPEYKYADTSQRGKVFSRANVPAPAGMGNPTTRTSDTAQAPSRAPDRPAPIMTSSGSVGAKELVGLDVVNPQNEKVGDIKDVLIGGNGAINQAIVGVGGFLGVGTRDVALNWSEFKFQRDDRGNLKAELAMSKDRLLTLPEYKDPQRAQAPASTR